MIRWKLYCTFYSSKCVIFWKGLDLEQTILFWKDFSRILMIVEWKNECVSYFCVAKVRNISTLGAFDGDLKSILWQICKELIFLKFLLKTSEINIIVEKKLSYVLVKISLKDHVWQESSNLLKSRRSKTRIWAHNFLL